MRLDQYFWLNYSILLISNPRWIAQIFSMMSLRFAWTNWIVTVSRTGKSKNEIFQSSNWLISFHATGVRNTDYSQFLMCNRQRIFGKCLIFHTNVVCKLISVSAHLFILWWHFFSFRIEKWYRSQQCLWLN